MIDFAKVGQLSLFLWHLIVRFICHVIVISYPLTPFKVCLREGFLTLKWGVDVMVNLLAFSARGNIVVERSKRHYRTRCRLAYWCNYSR